MFGGLHSSSVGYDLGCFIRTDGQNELLMPIRALAVVHDKASDEKGSVGENDVTQSPSYTLAERGH